jgi:hypothetical protein
MSPFCFVLLFTELLTYMVLTILMAPEAWEARSPSSSKVNGSPMPQNTFKFIKPIQI